MDIESLENTLELLKKQLPDLEIRMKTLTKIMAQYGYELHEVFEEEMKLRCAMASLEEQIQKTKKEKDED